MPRQCIRRIISILAVPFCLIGPSIMIAADILTISLNHRVNPLKHSISYFAAGPFGWLEKIGIVSVAIAFLLIAVNLLAVRYKNEFRMIRLDGVLLTIVALGFLMISLFNTNVIGTVISFHGLVHQLATIAVSFVFYLSCLITMFLMINKTGFKYFGVYSGLTCLIGFAVLSWFGFSYYFTEYMGLSERLISGFNLLWIILVAPQLIRLAKIMQ